MFQEWLTIHWILAAIDVFLVGFILFNLLNIIKALRSQQWPSTQGCITRANFRSIQSAGSSQDSSNYIDLSYTYDVLGQQFSAQRVAFGLGKQVRSRAVLRELIEQYKGGQAVTVYYNPSNPEQAVLEPANLRHIRGNIVVGVIFLVTLSYFLWRNLP